jgi:tRNA(fMet)-specific endonuclease VapC
MTSGRYLLDTGIVASLFRGDAGVRDKIAASDEIFVSSITLGELFYGAFKSQRTEIRSTSWRQDSSGIRGRL